MPVVCHIQKWLSQCSEWFEKCIHRIENNRLSVPQPFEYNGYYYIRHGVVNKKRNKISEEIR